MIQSTSSPKSLVDRLAVAFGTGLYVGFCPYAPGTIGSMWGPPLVGLMIAAKIPVAATLMIAVVFIAVGVPICTRAARCLGSHDPGSVVYDEVAAFWIVFLPHIIRQEQQLNWPSMLVGFLLFRLFDITKIWPASRLERLPDGTGIMADDLAAAVYAAIGLWLVETYLFPVIV